MSWVVVHGTGDAVGMYMEAPRKYMSNLSGTIFAFLGELSSGHKISALHSQSKFDAMVWSNILFIVSTSLQSTGSLRLGPFFLAVQ